MLQTLLAAIAGERVFIACRLEPKSGGGTNKIPVNPRTGLPSDAQDSTTWLTLAEALATGYNVGIVLHESLRLFCIDIDGALQPDGTWSALAVELCQRFPGAYVEISQSGTGLHIFGRCQPLPDHRTRRDGLKLEVYTRRRFILLTGTSGTGDIQTDHTTALQAVIAQYLPEPVVQHSDQWTTGPFPGWRGGGTDEQIINMLRNRRGPHASFGTGATFSDLFDANAEVLAREYPSGTGKDWNGSAVDQALANHFAWATGYDCERTLRLMWQSQLVRDKWHRDDYLRRTILTAVAGKIPADAVTVSPGLGTSQDAADYINNSPPGPPPPPADLPPPPGPPSPFLAAEALTGNRFMTASDQERLFDGCIYIEDIHGVLLPNGSILAQRQFDVHFGGYDFQMRADGTKQTDSAWECFTQSQLVQFPKANGLTFDPRQDARAVIRRDGMTFINSWVPVPIEMKEGDVTPFLTHLYTLYPYGRDAEILLCYFAFLSQYPGVKSQWWPLLQGVEGNGKTFFSLALEYCVGQRYAHHAKASQLDNRFNAAFYGKLLICIEDVHISEAKSAMWESLKPMITNTRMEIEGKGLDKVTRDVCFNGIMNSNHKDGVRKTANDRRVAPFFGAQQHAADLVRCGLTKEYFQELYRWARNDGFAYVAHFLKNYQIPDELNPAKLCVRAPETSSTQQAITMGQGSIEQEIAEAVAEGRDGFRGGWIDSIAFDQLLKEQGKARYLPRSKRGELLEALGYIPHPRLPNGRVIRPLPNGTKPTLYCRKDHETVNSPLDWRDLPSLYVKAQAPE